MVDIRPFRGLRYNVEKLAEDAASLSSVTTPPYDVINAAQQEGFYNLHPHNFVRLDFNRKTPQDTPADNAYTRATEFLESWEQSGVLTHDAQPAVYAYSQSWDNNGETVERKGLLALLRLESLESGNVLPHEFTLKGPKIDRLDLMRSTLCSLSQVFFIYSDAERQMERLVYDNPQAAAEAPQEVRDADGVIHRFYPVQKPEILDQLQTLFADKSLLIADGHHRYETALAFQAEAREKIKTETGTEPPAGSLLSDYGVVFLTNMDDPGLKVYPTHRILEQWPDGWDQTRFETALFERFDIVETDETFSYRRPGTDKLVKLKLKATVKPGDLPALLDTFDAAILEEVVFKGILGQTGEALKQSHHLGFHRNDVEIEALWNANKAVGGFYMGTPDVALVHAICQSGNRMPQKSTYFYPKILSGLMIYPYRNFLSGNTSENALSGVLEAQPLTRKTVAEACC